MKKTYRVSVTNRIIVLAFMLLLFFIGYLDFRDGSNSLSLGIDLSGGVLLLIFLVCTFLFHFEVNDVGINLRYKIVPKVTTQMMNWSDIKKVKYSGKMVWRLVLYSDTSEMRISLLTKTDRNELIRLLEEKAINVKGVDRTELHYIYNIAND